jgi:hypothetical protein
MLDDYAAGIFADNINMMVPWYLMAAYAYYKQDEPILTDAFFDAMGKTMLEVWDDIDHRHKHLITRDDLQAGSYLGDYPSIVEGAIEELKKMKKI